MSTESVISHVTIKANGLIEVRREDRILHNGEWKVLGVERHVVAPGDSLVDQDPSVVAAATAAWTPEKVSAWNAEFVALMDAGRADIEARVAATEAAQADLAQREAAVEARRAALRTAISEVTAVETDNSIKAAEVANLQEALALRKADLQRKLGELASLEEQVAARTQELAQPQT
jgi:hypothetical protein